MFILIVVLLSLYFIVDFLISINIGFIFHPFMKMYLEGVLYFIAFLLIIKSIILVKNYKKTSNE